MKLDLHSYFYSEQPIYEVQTWMGCFDNALILTGEKLRNNEGLPTVNQQVLIKLAELKSTPIFIRYFMVQSGTKLRINSNK